MDPSESPLNHYGTGLPPSASQASSPLHHLPNAPDLLFSQYSYPGPPSHPQSLARNFEQPHHDSLGFAFAPFVTSEPAISHQSHIPLSQLGETQSAAPAPLPSSSMHGPAASASSSVVPPSVPQSLDFQLHTQARLAAASGFDGPHTPGLWSAAMLGPSQAQLRMHATQMDLSTVGVVPTSRKAYMPTPSTSTIHSVPSQFRQAPPFLPVSNRARGVPDQASNYNYLQQQHPQPQHNHQHQSHPQLQFQQLPFQHSHQHDDAPFGLGPAAHLIERPLSRSSEKLSRKRPRDERELPSTDLNEDPEQYIKSMSAKIAGYSFDSLAMKIKMIETNDPALKDESFFSLLFSAKDLKQEKHFQLFGIAWVQKSCEALSTAVVPRNRVYARYVQQCADSNIHPLTPNNFGKIVRLMFPNLKTRRLGMRGKSKYHYCGIKLAGEGSQAGSPVSSMSSNAVDSPQSTVFNTPSHTGSPNVHSMNTTPASSIQVQEYFETNEYKYLPGLYNMIERSVTSDFMNAPLNLPSIYSYLPRNYDDHDIADTLHLLNRVHCTSIFELMRYMQVEKMFQSFPLMPALTSGPVFKLYTSEIVQGWVRDCDLVMYRAMLKMLNRLVLQNVPKEILHALQDITKNYVEKLSATLTSKYPKQFVVMKLKVARQFVQLLKRLLRCVDTGVNASKVLSTASERSAMLNDWSKLDLRDIVLRDIPCAVEGTDFLIELLETRLVTLFEETPQERPVLAKYSAFLFELPSFFPRVNPWLFSLLLSNLLTSCIREMSLTGSRSFKSWWIVRCWVDEFVSWSFELGGFFLEEYRAQYGSHYEVMDHEQTSSANVSANIEANTADPSANLVDLLDGLTGEADRV